MRWTAPVVALGVAVSHLSAAVAQGTDCLDASVQWAGVGGMPASTISRSVTIERLNWESSSLLAHAAGILVEEALGIHVSFSLANSSGGAFRRIGEGPADASLEVWPNSFSDMAAQNQWVCNSCSAASAQAIRRCLRFRGFF